MADVFISYRRRDSEWSAGRLADRLSGAFGSDRVFLDTASIPLGNDFVKVINERLRDAKVVLAIIGPAWLSLFAQRSVEGSSNEPDFVLEELRQALASDRLVIPVLVDGAAPLNAAELPLDLKPLARLNAFFIRAGTFSADADILVRAIAETLGPNGRVLLDGKDVTVTERVVVSPEGDHVPIPIASVTAIETVAHAALPFSRTKMPNPPDIVAFSVFLGVVFAATMIYVANFAPSNGEVNLLGVGFGAFVVTAVCAAIIGGIYEAVFNVHYMMITTRSGRTVQLRIRDRREADAAEKAIRQQMDALQDGVSG